MAKMSRSLSKELSKLAKTESLKATLQSCFSEEWLRETASTTGLVKRRSKVDIVAFFWTLVLGFGTGTFRSLAELRRSFESSAGVEIVPSTFYDRFTPTLCLFLKKAVARACATLSEPAMRPGGMLSGFLDLVVADASVISLHKFLAEKFPACRSSASSTRASLKLHIVMSVFAASPRMVQLFSERTKELKMLKVGKWVAGRLLLFDLGYYMFSLFERIDRNGGYFISRAKDNFNPVITSTNTTCRGRSVVLVGKRLQDVLPLLKRKSFDVEALLDIKRRPYDGKQSIVSKPFRIVGVLNDETGAYHIYITNVPGSQLSPEDVARTYRARWEVELLFKELKSQYRIDELPSSKEHIVEALIYIAILTMTVSRLLLNAVRTRMGLLPLQTPVRRWAVTFKNRAMKLLDLLLDLGPQHRKWRDLETFLAHEAKDPNVKRSRNIPDLAA